ncbi:uncharacterized protein LOC127259342 [Andrographis paniculata]|uniref:uncharacterized protein LOC127259342 n=1 Tax=Andrographis paniculata TaxID=175694 RepID=UPI0021E91142|nr:uncharacterized protein LOC127259342 [Andrographis paniculata]
MAVAGLPNVSVFSPSIGDSQHSRPSKRASSLLQIWREIEGENLSNESRQHRSGSNSEFARQGSDNGDSTPQDYDDTGNPSFISLEMDHEDNSSVASEQSSDLDLGETERERVRQIFKEWMSSGSKGRFDLKNHSWQWPVRRQTLLDLLSKIQGERKSELLGLLEQRPVSSFAHRNRIQALLKGRFLRNERLVLDERPSSPAATELGLLWQRHAVSGLREEFLSKLENSASTSLTADSASTYSGVKEEESEIEIHEREDAGVVIEFSPEHTADGDWNLQESVEATNLDMNGDRTDQEGNSGWQEESAVGRLGEQSVTIVDNEQQPEDVQSTLIVESYNENVQQGNEISGSQEVSARGEESADVIEDESGSWHGSFRNQWSPEPSDNNVDNQDQIQESHQDWQSYTQAAIDSWLDVPSTHDEDGDVRRMELQELFSRGRVSSLLGSDFRESLNRVIQMHTERLGHDEDNFVEQDQDIHYDGDQTSADYDAFETYRPLPPSSTFVSATQPFWADDMGFTTGNWISNQQPGTEWEVINELRIDMARLHRRMNSMQSMLEECMDLQIELHRSVRQEVSAALNRAISSRDKDTVVPKDETQNELLFTRRRSSDPWDHVRQGVCCLCGDSKIDSLLYRCGHMCTCIKCAENLIQQRNGKCPMCEAPVVEVLRAYFIQE